MPQDGTQITFRPLLHPLLRMQPNDLLHSLLYRPNPIHPHPRLRLDLCLRLGLPQLDTLHTPLHLGPRLRLLSSTPTVLLVGVGMVIGIDQRQEAGL